MDFSREKWAFGAELLADGRKVQFNMGKKYDRKKVLDGLHNFAIVHQTYFRNACCMQKNCSMQLQTHAHNRARACSTHERPLFPACSLQRAFCMNLDAFRFYQTFHILMSKHRPKLKFSQFKRWKKLRLKLCGLKLGLKFQCYDLSQA